METEERRDALCELVKVLGRGCGDAAGHGAVHAEEAGEVQLVLLHLDGECGVIAQGGQFVDVLEWFRRRSVELRENVSCEEREETHIC